MELASLATGDKKSAAGDSRGDLSDARSGGSGGWTAVCGGKGAGSSSSSSRGGSRGAGGSYHLLKFTLIYPALS